MDGEMRKVRWRSLAGWGVSGHQRILIPEFDFDARAFTLELWFLSFHHVYREAAGCA